MMEPLGLALPHSIHLLQPSSGLITLPDPSGESRCFLQVALINNLINDVSPRLKHTPLPSQLPTLQNKMHPPVSTPALAPAATSKEGQDITTGSCYNCKCDVPTTPVKAVDNVLKAVGLRSKEHKTVVICECQCHGFEKDGEER